MLAGIIFGVLAATLQSSSYIFSRHFMARHANPVHLLIYSQLCMGLFSALILPFAFDKGLLSSTSYLLPVLICSLSFVFGQLCFFCVIKEIEASVASSLLGLKILILALLSIAFFKMQISGPQWLSLCVCMLGAMMMNGSSKKMNWRAAGWLLMTCLGYAISDLYIRETVSLMPGSSFAQKIILSATLSYLLLGLFAVPALLMIKSSRAAMKSAVPFAVCWFLAMLSLFACFAEIGPLFGNMVQSTRGLFSVALGALVARAGHHHLESMTSKKLFWLRAAAALLILAGIVCYGLSSR